MSLPPDIAPDSSAHQLQRWELTPAQRVKMGVKSMLGLTGVRPVSVLAGPARGVEMVLDFYGHTPLYLGMYEMELHRFTGRSLQRAHLVFDVGGYIGYDTLMFANASHAEIVTFEPDEERLPLLHHNVARNPSLRERIRIEPLAVGDRTTPGATTLDTMADRLGMPDLIKIDIDGGEVDALRGASKIMRRRHPDIIVETHSLDLERGCGAILVEHGYRPVVKHNRRIWREFRGLAVHNRWLLAEGRPVASR